MFQHVFAEMNGLLQEILRLYPSSDEVRRRELLCQYNLLRRLSDEALDEWLAFAEKLSQFKELAETDGDEREEAGPVPVPEVSMDCFVRGQGYYKLTMYRQSAQQFQQVIDRYPDSLAGRLYLAMSHLYLGEAEPAWNHLNHMLPLISSRKLKALIYNAQGCILASLENYKEAQDRFEAALRHDPSLAEPRLNLEVCRGKEGKLHYGSQLTQLL